MLFLPVFLFTITLLNCISIPLQIDWRNSFHYSFSDISDTESSGWDNMYKLRASIDILFTSGIRTRMALTNQDKRLLSQALFDYAIIDYQCGSSIVQIALKDHGYGSGFHLYNRRYDDVLYDRYALSFHRWQGISFQESISPHSFNIGVAGNELNRFLGDMHYNLKTDRSELTLFGTYIHHDNDFTVILLTGGYELITLLESVSLHSAFEYKYYPNSRHYGQMQCWHLINEATYRPLNFVKLTASSDFHTEADNNDINDIHELDCQLSNMRVTCDLGFRTQSLILERADTYFLDLFFSPVKSFRLGIFLDMIQPTKSPDYYQIGIQTGFTLK
jgi:hypothetical protein